MTPETRMLVQYRLDRAREALAEATLLLDSGHANTGVNRLYYACFYAVSALLLTTGLTATSHSGLRTLFHQHVIRPGWDCSEPVAVPMLSIFGKHRRLAARA